MSRTHLTLCLACLVGFWLALAYDLPITAFVCLALTIYHLFKWQNLQ